jgi:hypothetical protein
MDLVRVIRLAALVWAAMPIAAASAQLLSPGPLTRAHHELEGDANCGRCHSTGRGIDTQQCLSCHEDLGARIRAGQGFHGREHRGQSCGHCHVEHLGANAPLVRWPGGSRERFDHAESGWALEGAHRSLACARCHDGRNRRGAPTFLGERRECTSCHQDPHEGRFGATCTTCHDQSTWHSVRVEGGAFDHSHTRFPLRGEHGDVACARCHGTPSRWRGIEFDQCSDCHRDPHGGRFAQPCASCHVEDGWSVLDAIRLSHPGVSLANGHASVACGQCHDQGLDRPPATGTECVDCHRPVHQAQLGRDCARCHASIRWSGLPRRVGLSAHERTPFELHGAHLEVECDRCHDPSLPPNRRYRQLDFDQCRDCHASGDPHRGAFAERDGGECGPCHTETGFRPSRFGVELHATTRFPLEGRHESVPCIACHAAEIPRTWFRVDRQECADCHENPHGDQFAAEMAAGGCAHCHDAAGWDRPRIQHDTWPLTGAHRLVHCDSCHAPTPEDRRVGRGASYRGVPRDCAGCHEDVHAGHFALSEPRHECADCHDTAAFEIPSFDHAARTGFAIDGGHARLECSACHPSVRLEGGGQDEPTVRWRLGYRRCVDCHADPHAAASRGRPDGGTR